MFIRRKKGAWGGLPQLSRTGGSIEIAQLCDVGWVSEGANIRNVEPNARRGGDVLCNDHLVSGGDFVKIAMVPGAFAVRLVTGLSHIEPGRTVFPRDIDREKCW